MPVPLGGGRAGRTEGGSSAAEPGAGRGGAGRRGGVGPRPLPVVVLTPPWEVWPPDTSAWEDGPVARLYGGDCLRVMGGMPASSVDLVFADPPFNIGWNYDVYSDRRPLREYLDWTDAWLRECMRVLTDRGSIWVACGSGIQAEVRCRMDAAGFRWRRTVVWHYTFGPAQQGNLTPSWAALHYATCGERWTWNGDAVRVPSMRQARYRDKRADPRGKIPYDVWPIDHRAEAEAGRYFQASGDVWLESRVAGTFKERSVGDGPGCQMPLAVMDRVLLLSSNEGDVVLDPFLGYGTTGISAMRLRRRCLGIELSEAYLAAAAARVGLACEGPEGATAGE